MSTEPLPPSDSANHGRRRFSTRQIVYLVAMALVALGMIADMVRSRDLHVHGYWLVAAAILVLGQLWQPRHRHAVHTQRERRHRTGRGQKPMIWLVGGVFAAFAIANEILATGEHGPLWRVLVAVLAFLYLWWLSSQLFDLVFVWHRYIQGDAAHRFLRDSVQRKDFNPKNDGPEEPPPLHPDRIPPIVPSGGTPVRELFR